MTKITLHIFHFQTFNLINTLLKNLLSYYYHHQLLGNLVNCVTSVIGIILMTRFSFMFSLRAICIIIILSLSTSSRSKFDMNLFSLKIQPNNIDFHNFQWVKNNLSGRRINCIKHIQNICYIWKIVYYFLLYWYIFHIKKLFYQGIYLYKGVHLYSPL